MNTFFRWSVVTILVIGVVAIDIALIEIARTKGLWLSSWFITPDFLIILGIFESIFLFAIGNWLLGPFEPDWGY